MKDALHLINLITARFLAAVFCFALITDKTVIAAPQLTTDDVLINSLSIYPEYRKGNDSIYLIVDATLTTSGCGIEDYNVNITANQIDVSASFWQGDATAICSFTDTLFLGVLKRGVYELAFNQTDTLIFQVPVCSCNQDSCKANFTVIYPDCHPDPVKDCIFDSTQFCITSICNDYDYNWLWSFGDGQYSNERNPKHSYAHNGSYQVCLQTTINDSCIQKICKTINIDYASDSCIHRGTVYDYTGLDGCGFIIELDNGVKLEPVKILSNIELRDSMRVKLNYTPVDMASICMVGQTVIVTCIHEIFTEPCKANFTFSIYELASIPYTYYFENYSKGVDLEYLWDFGDGSVSTEINPVHSYSDTGIYLVCLKVFNENGCEDQICKRLNTGIVMPYCKAQFTHQYIHCDSLPIDSCLGYFVQFNDESYGDALLYNWDFGDGNVSFEQNPSHFYENRGFYTVNLKIESATDFRYCADEIAKQIRVGVSDTSCNAYFKYKAFSTYHYQFHEYSYGSNGNAIEVNWDFGDGTIASGQVVEHIFNEAGMYEVCATVITEDSCTSTYCQTIVIDEPTDCLSTFDYNFLPCECLNCACIQFISNTTDDVVEWFWDFGDSTFSHEPDPIHTYHTLQNKRYTVCLTAFTESGCKSEYCKNISVSGNGYEVPWSPVISGEGNHIIVVPEDISAPELEYGDYLGLFFKDENGNDVCGGMLEWKGEVNTLTAWGVAGDINELMLVVKNGFLPGETFGYKIWKHASNQIIEIAQVNYEIDEIVTDSSVYRSDGLSKLIALKSCDSQNIQLHRGWNLISLNAEPTSTKMADIFNNSQKVLVKNAVGEIVYCPFKGIEDGEWNILEGYKVRVWEDMTLRVCGNSIEPQTSIPLNGNIYPTFLPYFYQFEYPIESALNAIIDDVKCVQSLEYLDGTGKIMALNYIPAYNINQIGDMKPGLAYRLSLLTTLKSFTYPEPFIKEEVAPVSWDSQNRNTTTNQLKAAFDNSDQNRVLVIPENVISLNSGDEINIYTSDNFFAGSWLYNGEGNTAVTLWDNPDMTDYGLFEISIVNSNRIETARYSVNIEEDVNIDGMILELKKATATNSEIITIDNSIKVYPNPANNIIRFELPGEDISSDVSIQIFDLSGRVVLERNNIINGNIVTVNIENLNKGVYLMQIKSLNNVYKTKFAKGN